MEPLKIGVLTFHRCINYGSYWQARCLAEGLSAKGHKAEILDHESRLINLREWKCAYRPLLPSVVPEADYPLYRKKIEGFFSTFDSLPLSARFPLNDPGQMENYDVVVVGSDEVWNLFHPWYGKNPVFYGDGIKAQRLVSYAASFGNYPASAGLEEAWEEKLRNFAAISVRDVNSQVIVENITGTAPPIVLDPCLQFPVNAEERSLDHLPVRYAAVYGHNFSPFFIREIKKWAANRNLPLVSIGYTNEWADQQWIIAEPHDFAQFIARAEAVATNFFHGCVFSLRNAKPFVCETTPYRSIKLQGLMEKVGGEKHLVNENTPSVVYSSGLNEPLPPAIINKIDLLRESSNTYLDMALSATKLQVA